MDRLRVDAFVRGSVPSAVKSDSGALGFSSSLCRHCENTAPSNFGGKLGYKRA